MDSMDSPDPWYLTVVRTQGIPFLRPEKSWRPIVNITVVDADTSHETVLGCDGQNPNLKSPFVIRDIDHATRLDIKVYHKSHSKNRKKRNLIGTAYHTVGDLVRRQARPGCDLDLRLSCPPPQKRSPTIGGTRQLNSATLTIRLRPPLPPPAPPPSSSSVTLIASASSSQNGDGNVSDAFSSDIPLASPSTPEFNRVQHGDIEVLPPTGSSLRRRRRPKKPRGYTIYSDEAPCSSESEFEPDSSCPPTPSPGIRSLSSSYETETDMTFTPCCSHQTEEISISLTEMDGNEEYVITPRILPRHVGQISLADSRSLAVRLLESFSPYKELNDANGEQDIEKVLGRLLTEWYVIGASLLAVAGLNATIFGLSPGSLFQVGSLAQRCIALGSISSGIGIVADAWLLVLYSGANAEKFESLARDVYGTYFFFCLTCRVPTLCMFLASCSLTVFLLTVAWSAWPTAVLVMSFVAGTLFSLQYLVFGFHRMINLFIWVAKSSFKSLARVTRRGPSFPEPQIPEADSSSSSPPPSLPTDVSCEIACPAREVAAPSPAHSPVGRRVPSPSNNDSTNTNT